MAKLHWLFLLLLFPVACAHADINSVLRQANADVAAGRFSDAVALVQAQSGYSSNPALRHALADYQYAWAIHLFGEDENLPSISHFDAAYVLDKGDRIGQSEEDLLGLGTADSELSRNAQAAVCFQQCLQISRQLHNPLKQAQSLTSLGMAENGLSRYTSAVSDYQQALPLYARAGDSSDQADTWLDMGVADDEMSRHSEAAAAFKQALLFYQRNGNKDAQADALGNLGEAYEGLSQYDHAISCDQQSLALLQEVGTKDEIANAYSSLGDAYEGFSQYTQAIADYQQGLALYQQTGDQDAVANNLNDIAIAYEGLSQYGQAVNELKQALPIYRNIGDKAGEAAALGDIGGAERILGQDQIAIGDMQQAVSLCSQAGDRDGEADSLTNLGNAYEDLNRFGQAESVLKQALTLYGQTGHQEGEVTALDDLGIAYLDERKTEDALAISQQSLALAKHIGAIDAEGKALDNIGSDNEILGRYVEDVDSLQQALPLFEQVQDRDGQAKTEIGLMLAWQNQHRPRLAIFYGKQGVNAYQGIRQGIQKMDPQTQQSYLATISSNYRFLADILISQGRLPEAQEVLRMLKQTEFYDFLNSNQGQPSVPAPMDTVAWTPHEQRWLIAYNGASNAAKAAVDAQMAADFAKPATSADTLPNTAQEADLAAALTPGTVAVYTIVEPNKLDLIVVTPAQDGQSSHQIYRSAPVSAATLYQQVYNFRSALTDPTTDPRALGATLYKEVFGPIQADLDSAHASTVLFSLDDALRYLPIAALYDSQTKQYVVQRYATAIFTLVGTPEAATASVDAPQVLGAGVSQSLDGLPALPGVAEEIGDIVRSRHSPQGMLPGTAMLDPAFTQQALLGDLGKQRFSYVHLASHFALRPSDTDSYLLMGDGSHLSVGQIAQDPHLFAGVDLLTLSACDTDMEERSSTGKEIEGFGALAQQLGAKSVLASLWPVSDAATPLLMTAFYRDLRDHPAWPLPRVLQAAQLEMLTGSASIAEQTVSAEQTADTAHRGTEMINAPTNLTMPSFTAPSGAPYAHPDYWAPFVLIGGWR